MESFVSTDCRNFVKLQMSIVHFSVLYSRKTRKKETDDHSDTVYSGCFLKEQVLTSRSDLHGFGSCKGYCHSDTVQYKAQKIYFLLGTEYGLLRVDSEAKDSKQTNSISYISMT